MTNRCSHVIHEPDPVTRVCIEAQCSAPASPEHVHRWTSAEDREWGPEDEVRFMS